MYPFFWTVSEKRGTYQAKKGTNAGMKATARIMCVVWCVVWYVVQNRVRVMGEITKTPLKM